MPRRKRRSKGSGSVHEVSGKGWCAQRELARVGGERRFERRFFGPGRAGKAAAHAQVAAWAEEALALTRHPRAADTVLAWCQHWLTTKVGVVSDKTLAFYKRHLEYATAHLGELPLIALTAQHIRDMLAALMPSEPGADDGLSPQSRKHVRTVLGMALELAVNDGVILKNPISAVEPPKVKKFEATALDDAQLAALFAAVAGSRLDAMWHLLADFGMRLEEILSARWADYRRDARTLRIRSTKNDSERTLTLLDQHVQLMDAHWERLQLERSDNPRWAERGYLFPSEVGTKLIQSNVRRAFKDALERAGLPRRIRIHDLRHTAATNLIAAGNDVATVQYITGHKDSAVLLEIYTHHQEARNRAAVERVAQKRKGA